MPNIIALSIVFTFLFVILFASLIGFILGILFLFISKDKLVIRLYPITTALLFAFISLAFICNIHF